MGGHIILTSFPAGSSVLRTLRVHSGNELLSVVWVVEPGFQLLARLGTEKQGAIRGVGLELGHQKELVFSSVYSWWLHRELWERARACTHIATRISMLSAERILHGHCASCPLLLSPLMAWLLP